MCACVELPQCIKLSPSLKYRDVLYICVSNSCNYDLILSLHIKDRMGNILQNLSIELEAEEEKHVEVPLRSTTDSIVISGEWSLKGTSLKIHLEEVTVNR